MCFLRAGYVSSYGNIKTIHSGSIEVAQSARNKGFRTPEPEVFVNWIGNWDLLSIWSFCFHKQNFFDTGDAERVLKYLQFCWIKCRQKLNSREFRSDDLLAWIL